MNSFMEVMDLVKGYFLDQVKRNELSQTAYNCWIKDIEPITLEGDKAILAVKAEFHRGILISQYLGRLEEAFQAVLGFPIKVEIITGEDDSGESDILVPTYIPAESFKTPPPEEKVAFVSDENGYTFDNFVVGSKNEFAYTACKAVATNYGVRTYNPLFIYGPSGLGKTHLLMAIKHEVLKRNPDINILYTNSETFTNDLILALGNKSIAEFHKKYRHADFFLIDDIQFLAGKERSQEEFFHTFNELYYEGKQIVITSDRPPKDISVIEERLRSRFESGLIADISHPDMETRIAIIKKKAQALQLNISDDIVNFIAAKLKSNIRQLEGAIKKIKVYKVLTGSDPTLSVAQNVIKDILNDNQPVNITIDKIIEEVAQTYNVTPEDIRSKKRSSPISSARQVAIYITREVTQIPMKQIGQEFGNRDHTTIVYSLNEVEKLMKKNPHEKGIIQDIIKNIKNQ